MEVATICQSERDQQQKYVGTKVLSTKTAVVHNSQHLSVKTRVAPKTKVVTKVGRRKEIQQQKKAARLVQNEINSHGIHSALLKKHAWKKKHSPLGSAQKPYRPPTRSKRPIPPTSRITPAKKPERPLRSAKKKTYNSSTR